MVLVHILGSWNSEGHWNRNAKLSMIVVPFSSRLLGKYIIKWSFSLRWRWLMRSSIWESLGNSSSFWSLLYWFLLHMVWLWNFVHKCNTLEKLNDAHKKFMMRTMNLPRDVRRFFCLLTVNFSLRLLSTWCLFLLTTSKSQSIPKLWDYNCLWVIIIASHTNYFRSLLKFYAKQPMFFIDTGRQALGPLAKKTKPNQ